LGNVVNAQEQQPLKLIISPAKENYVSGDTALFSVSVQNTSDKPLRVLRYKKGGGDNYIWHDCTCIHSLFKGPKSDTIVLGPGEKYEFVLKEEQLSALDDSKRRIFILEYKMSDYRYFESEKPSWIDEVAQDSPLWTGFLKSNPVRINVENNCDELE
jgi:hypothetical protein